MKGLDVFREYFKDFQDCYLIIGGAACDIQFEETPFTPRVTNDIDIILVIEAIEQKPEFVSKFWKFIREGDYEIRQKNMEERNCYRFSKPATEGFPEQVELFCRVPDAIDLNEDAHLTPIPVEEGLSSLSAILLNEEYYHFTLDHSDYVNDVHVARPEALICLKAFAFLSNTKRRDEGQNVRNDEISKHKLDVFRLTLLLRPDEVFDIPEAIRADLLEFASIVGRELPVPRIFRANGFVIRDMNVVWRRFLEAFNLWADEGL